MKIAELHKHLNSIEFISEVKRVETTLKPQRVMAFLFKSEITIQEEKASIYIGFKENFPLTKPILFLESHNQFGFIPHIEPDGYICFAYDEGLVLDFNNPQGIIEECIKLAKSTINNGISGKNNNDFFNEFDNYLLGNKHTKSKLHSFIEITESVKKIGTYKYKDTVLLCESKSKLKRHNLKGLLGYNNEKLEELHPFIFAHIKSPIKPKEFNEKWYRNELLDFLDSNLSITDKSILNRSMFILDTTNILLHFYTPNSSNCLVGFNLKKKGLKKKEKDIEIIAYSISRADSQYVSMRGGISKDIGKNKVLLIGCGSVGGFIAHKLVKSGIIDITLIDNDIFTLDNINRHILGLDSRNKPKTEALKTLLENSSIITKIISINENIEKAIETKMLSLADYDLIISATGNPTINLWLNDMVIDKYNTPLIITWVEPLGIGGHSILTNNTKRGCYRCLMDQENYNRAAFYEAKQSFVKSITSCSSVFTPYGVLDAESSANICIKQALSFFLGNEDDNPIISWKGESEDFIKNGYKLSARYNLSEEELKKHRYAYKKKMCEICAKQ